MRNFRSARLPDRLTVAGQEFELAEVVAAIVFAAIAGVIGWAVIALVEITWPVS